jgi:glycine cleavage system H protein
MAETRYTTDHGWVRLEDDGTATVGITDHAQEGAGEIVFVELPEPGREVAEGEACAVVESDRAANDVFAPMAGRVAEVNDNVAEDPGFLNRDPEGEAWLFRLEPDDASGFEGLMDADAYEAFLETL